MGLEKATLQNVDTGEAPFPVLFNPAEYTVARTNQWTPKGIIGYETPTLNFTGGEVQTLKMELFFDVTDQPTGDVTTHVNKLWKLAIVNEQASEGKRGRPPVCIFAWGKSHDGWGGGTENDFKAVIQSLSVRYTLFRDDGTPIRATADVTFMQVMEKTVMQNPTSYVPQPGYKRRLVMPRDTLAGIAFDEYGDATLWRKIAEANQIDDPEMIRAGDLLAIPPRR
jgi:nucleoid-associated protein YgaU